jgi:serine/threonine protein kinase
VYLITELVTGGELLEAVLQRGTYSEAEARLAFVQLLKGIEYLHSKCVCSGAGCRHGQSAA